MSTAFTGNHMHALNAVVDAVLDVYGTRESSVESGKRWQILSAVFHRLNDWQQIEVLQAHLSRAMYTVDGETVADYVERVSFFHDLGDIADCLYEGSRDICKVCKCMEGLHTRNSFKLCPEQPGIASGPQLLSNTFTR